MASEREIHLHEAILETVSNEDVPDQQSLIEHLEKRYNKVVNQSTLSRHLRKLGIRKRMGYYRLQAVTNETSEKPVAKIITCPPNLIVMNTLPGHAHAIAYRLDSLDLEGVVGTVAGDDTIFLALGDPSFMEPVRRSLEDAFIHA
jgi:transcriptional regulator of arginine metabolism